MNIKSLLLGSAAALVAVSGARAADAVVMAEPEPMEYVRVCDTYGVGYFYIPGTETCLRVGGYIRFDVSGGDLLDSPDDSYDTNARFSLQVSTASETELGTLRTYAEARFNYGNGGNDTGLILGGVTPQDLDGDGQLEEDEFLLEDEDIDDSSVSLNFAWIQLGGLRVGKDESLFTTWTGYAGNVILDDLIPYGPFDTNLISYTFDAGNGFSAAVSVEEGNDTDEIDSYVPHVVAGLKYTLGFGGISAVAAYDANNEEFAGKVRLDVNVNEQFSAFVMGGYKTDDLEGEGDEFDFNDGSNYYGNWEGNDDDDDDDDDGFAVWAGASYVLNERATINGQAAYDGGDNFGASLNVAYEVVPGFKITPEIGYVDNFGDDDDDLGDDFGEDGRLGGLVRFQRSF